MLSLFKLLLAVSLIAGCTGKEATVSLKANVKTNQGDPVQGAVVSLDGKALGETDLHGIFETRVNVPVGIKKRVEIKKESETYYFAPYYEGFTLADSSAQELTLNAMLYFVPKPSANAEVPAVVSSPEQKNLDQSKTDGVGVEEGIDPAVQIPTVNTAEPAKVEDPATISPSEFASIKEEDIDDHAEQEVKPLTENVVDIVKTKSTGAEKLAANTENSAFVEEELISAETVTVPVEPVGIPEALAAPIKERPANDVTHVGKSLFTIHVFAGKVPVPDVAVAYGLSGSSDLIDACKTNDRGRCVVRFTGTEAENVTIVATKSGFKTVTKLVTMVHKGRLQLQIDRGQTLDIYALEKNYNYKNGIENAEVFINGKAVGRTDPFGKFSYLYEGKKEDLLSVSIKSKSHMPEVFETDFIASETMNLVKFFAPATPPPAKVVVLSPRIAGQAASAKAALITNEFDQKLRHATSQNLFSSAAFKEYPQELLEKHLKSYGAGAADILAKGWKDLDIKKMVDVLLVPTVVFEDQTYLELSMIDAQGTTVAAAKEVLDDVNDAASINRAVNDIAKKVIRAFPFEGAVLSKNGNTVTVNLGFASGRGVKPGDNLDVYGLQVEKHGKAKTFGKIGTLVIKEISDADAVCLVKHVEPRAVIERGDIVALRGRNAPSNQSSAMVRVTSGKSTTENQVVGANVYFNDIWIGSTDSDGRLYAEVTGTGTLKVIKQGFSSITKHVGMRQGVRHEVDLIPQSAFLRVDSIPQGAKVSLDGKIVGVTPLLTPIPVRVGFVKLQLQAEAGYKTYAQVLELDEGTLDLTGARALVLEADLLKKAAVLLGSGKFQDAASELAQIPETHSDFLSAQHELGQIFLTNLDMPARAAEAFGKITANEAVKSFTDKRFIGSHINEGIALFQTAEKIVGEKPEVAMAHYKKAIEVLEGALPHLRHVPAAQYAKAVHNVDYFRALARHRLWSQSKDPGLLSDTLRTWKSYIDGSAQSIPAQSSDRAFVENARVYYKQALASYNNGKAVSKQ